MNATSVLDSGHAIGDHGAHSARRRRRLAGGPAVVYAVLLLAGLGIGLVASRRSYQLYFALAWGCFVVLLAMWTRFPRVALATTLALTLVADEFTISWFPFNKNLSSIESIMYLSDGLSLSPLEITVVWALALTMLRQIARTGRPLVSAPLVPTFMVFTGFIVLGLARGLSRGGDLRAALYEVRPLLLFPLLYLLVINVCSTRQDYRRMFWAAFVGIVLQSLLTLEYLSRLSPEVRDSLEELTQHGAAIGANLLFVVTISALTFNGVSGRLRLTLLLSSVPVVWVWIAGQRRAAVVTLVLALGLFGVTLFWRQRRTFWRFIPIITLVVAAYTGAFWNSQAASAFPAQAIKSVIVPDGASEADQSSDLYRILENLNLSETIRASPVLGIGFGQPFLRPYPLPDISFFELNAYLPHNSFLYIWTKLGFGGFVTLLFLIASTMMRGAARARAAPSGPDAVIALAAVQCVAMFSMYLYLDIAWEPRNIFLLALSMGVCTGPLLDDAERRARPPTGEYGPRSGRAVIRV